MYFNVSERIALNSSFSRSQIEKIDEFLAGPYVKRFELRQVREKTGINDTVSEILDEYVKSGILGKEVIKTCPIHGIELDKTNRNEGLCIECGRQYAYEDCPVKTVYIRKRQPDRQRAYAEVSLQTEGKSLPWYKDARFIIRDVVVVLLVAIITIVFGRDIINVFYQSEMTTTAPSIEKTIEFSPTIQSTNWLDLSSPRDMTAIHDITPEVTSEPTLEIEVIEEIGQE